MLACAVLVFVCSLGIPARDAGEPTLRPPFRVQWEINSRFDSAFFIDRGKQLVLFDGQRIVSIDVKTGKKKWARVFEKARGVLTYDEDRHEISLAAPFVSSYSGYEHERLSTIDGSLRSYPFNKPCICTWQNLMMFKEGSQPAQAFDMNTGKVVWSLPSLPNGSDYRLSSIDDKLFVRTLPRGLYCFDFRDGKELWRNETCDVSPWKVMGDCFFAQDSDRMAMLDARTGTELWSMAIVGNVPFSWHRIRFIGANKGVASAIAYSTDLVGYDLRTGHVRWKITLSEQPHRALTALDCQGGTLVQASNELSFYDAVGKRQWNFPLGVYDSLLLCANSEGFVVNTPLGVAYYRHEKPADLPKLSDDRNKLAEELIGRYETLSAAESSLLLRLGETTFDAFEKRVSDAIHDPVFHGLNDFDRLFLIAQKVTHPHHTSRLIDLFRLAQSQKSQPECRRFLLKVLKSFGDCNQATPVFLSALKESLSNPTKPQDVEIALDGLTQSNNPSAIDTLIQLMKDPAMSSSLRRQCYGNLYRSGSIAALRAIRSERSQPTPLPSLSTRLRLDRISETGEHSILRPELWNVVITYQDRSRWMLLVSDVLGGYDDRFICEWDGNGWSDLHYVDVITDDLYLPVRDLTTSKLPATNAPTKLSPEWAARNRKAMLAENDSDHDGLADTIEERFGTDPQKADTDGDGLIDTVDLNPTTKRSPVTDTEKCIAASFEATFKYSERLGPIVVQWPKGVKPFELSGYNGSILDRDKVGAFFQTEGYLVRCLNLTFARTDPNECVAWDHDRQSAHVKFWVYSGLSDRFLICCDLEKVDSEWIVVRLKTDTSDDRDRIPSPYRNYLLDR
jgi:outer membrane protein assembly factor BamB